MKPTSMIASILFLFMMETTQAAEGTECLADPTVCDTT